MSEFLIFFLMVAAFAFAATVLKLPIGLSLALAAILGSISGSQGISLRHLVEGSFGFFDTILIIVTAVIFMKVLEAAGILDSLTSLLLRTFYKKKFLLLLSAMFIAMFPGMIIGSSVAAVLTSGPLIAPLLMKLGLPKGKTAAFLAMGGIVGMIAPPVNIMVMIMGAGVDMPYVGVALPLLAISIPLAIIISLWIGYRDIKIIDYEEMMTILPESLYPKYGFRLYLPLILVLGLMLGQGILVKFMPDIGIPGIFLLGSLVGIFCGRPLNYLKITQKAIEEAMPILCILAGVGMFIQIMTLTGARGWTVISILSFPSFLLYLGISLSLPLFGGVSCFGAVSIFGIPFILALVGKNAILTTSALSTIAAIGDLMLPAAVAARFSAQIVGEPHFSRILRHCLVPSLFILTMGIGVLLFSPFLDKIF